jgi:LPXTG-motif cell wall-anchored protein
VRKLTGTLLLLCGIARLALAVSPVSSPEFDLGLAGSALTILAGALLLRRRRRKS